MTDLSALRGLKERVELAAIRLRADAFWSKVVKAGPDDCWIWGGYCTPRTARRLSYGVWAYAKHRRVRTHRAAYMLANGEIPPGSFVCHSCDVPHCCNPAHLWIGSALDNNQDRSAKGRTVRPPNEVSAARLPRGESHHSAKLTNADVELILASTESASSLARRLGVNISTICRIRRGKSWRSALLAQEEQP